MCSSADAADEGRALLDRGRLRPGAVRFVGCGDRGLELGVGDGVVGLDRLARGGVGHGIAHRVSLLVSAPRQSRSAAVHPHREAGWWAGGPILLAGSHGAEACPESSSRHSRTARNPHRRRGHDEEQVGEPVQVRHDLRVGQAAGSRPVPRPDARRGGSSCAPGPARRRSSTRPAATNSFGCSTSSSSSSISRLQRGRPSPAVTRDTPSVSRSRRSTWVASSAPTTKSSRWSRRISSASRASVRSVAAPIDGARQPERGDGFVGGAVGVGAQVGLADPVAAEEQARRPRVALAGVDAQRAAA